MSQQAMVGYLSDAILTKLDDLTLAGDGVTGETRFEDLGLDSLSLVELALMIDRDFGVVVTDEQLADWETVGAAAAHIARYAADAAPRQRESA